MVLLIYHFVIGSLHWLIFIFILENVDAKLRQCSGDFLASKYLKAGCLCQDSRRQDANITCMTQFNGSQFYYSTGGIYSFRSLMVLRACFVTFNGYESSNDISGFDGVCLVVLGYCDPSTTDSLEPCYAQSSCDQCVSFLDCSPQTTKSKVSGNRSRRVYFFPVLVNKISFG